MTGRLRFGKMSTGILVSASPLARTTATTATRTVYGLLMAKTIGFIGSPRPASEGPIGLGIEVHDPGRGLGRHLRPEEGLVGGLVAGVARGQDLPVDPHEAGLVLAV